MIDSPGAELGGRDWVSYHLILFILYHMDLKFTPALYSKRLSALKKGRDLEFDINILNQNWLDMPCDCVTELMGDTL